MKGNTIKPIEMQTIDVSTIGVGFWTAIGNPLEGALSFLRITNDSNTDVIISFGDGNDHIYIPMGDTRPIYLQANAVPTNYISKLKKNTVVYVRGNVGVGGVALSGYYNE